MMDDDDHLTDEERARADPGGIFREREYLTTTELHALRFWHTLIDLIPTRYEAEAWEVFRVIEAFHRRRRVEMYDAGYQKGKSERATERRQAELEDHLLVERPAITH